MGKIRVVHYMNQFFAGIGGEDKADIPQASKQGPVGPGVILNSALGDSGEVVGTVYAGDNYLAEHSEGVLKTVELIDKFKPDVVVSGPAFQSGRYGLNCGAICAMVQENLGIPALAGMHEENAGVELYKSNVYIVRTRETAAGMSEALKAMTRLALKLANKEPLGSPQEEGYIPQGRRVYGRTRKIAAERAIEMLLAKVQGRPYITEWPLPKDNRVTPAKPLKDLPKKKLALITTAGLVPKGNPDKLQSAWATKWLKYNIADVADLTSERWETVHGGYQTLPANEDPDRIVPLDCIRDLEKVGGIGHIYDFVFTTVGNSSSISTMRRFGQEMANELKKAGVDGVILTSA